MTFSIKPSVNIEATPSAVSAAQAYDAMLPDCVLGTAISVTEIAGPSLNAQVGTGSIFLKGYYVNITVAETKAITDNATRYIGIQLTRNANSEVTGATVFEQASVTPPTDGIILAKVITSGGDITNITTWQVIRSNDGQIVIKYNAVAPTGTNLSADNRDGMIYETDSDSNNQKIAILHKANGAVREIILWG